MRLGGGGFGGAPLAGARTAFGAAHVAAHVGGAGIAQRGHGAVGHNANHGNHRHAHFRGRRGFGYPFYGGYYNDYAFYDDGCYELVRVRTPHGLRWQREYVCY